MKFALICLSIFGIIISLSVYSFRMTSKPVSRRIKQLVKLLKEKEQK